MFKKLLIVALVASSLFMGMGTTKIARAVTPGGVFVTGHDPDYHAFVGSNALGAQHIIQDAVNYVTNGAVISASNKLLLVTDVRNPGGDESDPRNGMDASGYAGMYDVADYGSGTPGVLDLHTVNFSNYPAVVVASDYGGWLRQDELDILNARAADLASYVNNGGGIVAFAESGTRPPGTTSNRFGFMPFLTASAPQNQSETGNTVTPYGQTLGLTNSDVNGNFSHNIFTSQGSLNIVDQDPALEILSLATRGQFQDFTKPTCTMLGVVNGTISVNVQDSDGGLQGPPNGIVVSTTNATSSIAPYSAGTTSPVLVQATKVQSGMTSSLTITATDQAGNQKTCDPVLTNAIRSAGKPETMSVGGVGKADHLVHVANDRPGVENLSVTVNGQQFVLHGMKDGQSASLDIAGALKDGANSVTITTTGKPGGSAAVLFGDI